MLAGSGVVSPGSKTLGKLRLWYNGDASLPTPRSRTPRGKSPGDIMARPSSTKLVLIVALLLTPLPLVAQEGDAWQGGTAPAYLSIVDGIATVEREGQIEEAVANLALLDGDRIRTESGRLEVLLPDGSTLHLDHYTTVDLLAVDLFRLLEGRIRLFAAGMEDPSNAVVYQVDTEAGTVWTRLPGEYRIDALPDGRVELAVIRGDATLTNELGSRSARAGERIWAGVALAPGYPTAFNSARWDAFDRWSEAQRGTGRMVASRGYLPAELHVHARTFDHHGRWDYVDPYGYVWYPTVATAWRPYFHGRWKWARPWGWTWVSADPWGWPTHHFGRWGFSSGAWFWIPGRTWGPAWVHWAVAPSYVSWTPLDFYGRPVIPFYGVRGIYDPWLAWTVVPRHSFGVSVFVSRVAVSGHTVIVQHRPTFVQQRTGPPAPVGVAVPRSATGSGVAVPRRGTAVTSSETGFNDAGASPTRRQVTGQAVPRSPAGVAPGARTSESSRPGESGGEGNYLANPRATVRSPGSRSSQQGGESQEGAGTRQVVPRRGSTTPGAQDDSSDSGSRPSAVPRSPRAAPPRSSEEGSAAPARVQPGATGSQSAPSAVPRSPRAPTALFRKEAQTGKVQPGATGSQSAPQPSRVPREPPRHPLPVEASGNRQG
jgi:hypothetical protein